MNKISYHLILVNSSLRVLIDQIEQLCECLEERDAGNLPSVTEATQRLNYPLTTSNFSKRREVENIGKIITGRGRQESSFAIASADRPEKSIINSVYESIKRTRKGIAFKQIQKKTGFNRRQIANAIYKLKEKNMITNKKRGTYITSSRSIKFD